MDVVLVMGEGFVLEEAPRESRTVFSHADADMPAFVEFWQTRRDGTKRGILEVIE